MPSGIAKKIYGTVSADAANGPNQGRGWRLERRPPHQHGRGTDHGSRGVVARPRYDHAPDLSAVILRSF